MQKIIGQASYSSCMDEFAMLDWSDCLPDCMGESSGWREGCEGEMKCIKVCVGETVEGDIRNTEAETDMTGM